MKAGADRKQRAARRNAERAAAKPNGTVVKIRRAEPDWIEAAMAETMALSGGSVVREEERRGGGSAPYKRMSGMDWLLSKKRIVPHQFAAGTQYGDDWRAVNEPALPSCLKEMRGDGAGSHPLDRISDASIRLSNARIQALSSHPEMVALCDAVAGRCQRIRAMAEDEGDVQKKEAVFTVALDLLARHYGMTNA